MTQQTTRPEKLRQFIDDFFDGKQKRLAEAYELSPSLVSTWINPKNEKSEVPGYMDQIIDLKRQVQRLSAEIKSMRMGRVMEMKSGYAVVHFPDAAAPGAILCRGISDIETAKNLADALQQGSKETQDPDIKES